MQTGFVTNENSPVLTFDWFAYETHLLAIIEVKINVNLFSPFDIFNLFYNYTCAWIYDSKYIDYIINIINLIDMTLRQRNIIIITIL